MTQLNLNNVSWVRKYPVDTLQIYFASSLEIQDELTKKGYKVPMDKTRRIRTPVPIIYSNFRGWLTTPEPITIERLIPPEWYGKTPEDLKWERTEREGKEAFNLPPEEVYVDVGLDDRGFVYFKLDIKDYHLERASIRGVNPEKWNNWAMFYISAEYLDDLLSIFEDAYLPAQLYVVLEKQQGGKEKTYYASPIRGKSLGIPIANFSLCLGCFDLSLLYLRHKAIENGLSPDIVSNLRLRLEHSPELDVGLKVGVAKIEGKRPQIMFKLSSNTPMQIKGTLKPVIEGKARGRLIFCEHKSKAQVIVANARLVYSALLATKQKLSSL